MKNDFSNINYTAFLLRCGALIMVALLLFVFGKYLLPALLPFVVGGLVATALRPSAHWIRRVTHMRYRPAAATACLFFYGLFGLLLCNVGFLLFAQTVAFFTRLPELFATTVLPTATTLWERTVALISRFLPDAGLYMEDLTAGMTALTTNTLSQLSTGVLHWATAFVTRLPILAINVSLGILSSFFILMDYDNISAFLFRQLSPRMKKATKDSKAFLLSTAKNVVKAYFLLMFITFCEVSLGLWLLGTEYFAVMGIIVAAVDILPILGSGAVLIPWGLYLLFTGMVPRGVGILLLYAVITVVRTMAEPKILGDRIGLPPLVTIVSMYMGLSLFGFWGLILTPMAVTLLVHLNSHGQLRLWKRKEDDG
ncbi:MAG: sporulation integral membrane protein YtvI [Angelakisella sp.]